MSMSKFNFDSVIGVVCVAGGLIGIGYAIGTHAKMNEMCEKLDTTMEDISDSVDVDIPQHLVDEAVERAVNKEVERAVRKATDRVIADTEKDISAKVNAAVKTKKDEIEDKVSKEIANRVSKIDEAELKKKAVARAEDQIAEKFNGQLDDILDNFNGELKQVAKIYRNINTTISGTANGPRMGCGYF